MGYQFQSGKASAGTQGIHIPAARAAASLLLTKCQTPPVESLPPRHQLEATSALKVNPTCRPYSAHGLETGMTCPQLLAAARKWAAPCTRMQVQGAGGLLLASSWESSDSTLCVLVQRAGEVGTVGGYTKCV